MSRTLKFLALCALLVATACSDPAAGISGAGADAQLECGGYLGSGNIAGCS